MNVPANLKYSAEHEWVRMEGDRAYLGITDFAQHSLGDIVFIELPAGGKKLNPGDIAAVVESVKAVSDVYSPIGGTVAEVNSELEDSPEKLNEDPYGSWIAVLENVDAEAYEKLMSPAEYEKFCQQEG